MIRTSRLLLRAFIEADRDPWAAMNADPEVMRHFPGILTRAEADAVIERVNGKIAATGVGFWALERQEDGLFLGFAGLNRITHANLPIHGQWEVGWRLRREAWGHGYATEAGAAALAHGFGQMGLPRILAYTARTNEPSQAVMRRLGMHHVPDMDFDHPLFEQGAPARRHVVFVKEA